VEAFMAVVYKIVHQNSGESYVGSSCRAPFGRWIEHFSNLRMKRHPSKKFQAKWDTSRLEDWAFYVLESEIPETNRFAREQYWFDLVHPTLNGTCRISRVLDKKHMLKRVKEMLAAGVTYRKISAATGCSIGALTTYKRLIETGEL
jgi:hypothetical protein